jgi:hypothetical protein
MAHFARINARGFVSQVIVAEQDFIDSLPDADSWVQTSYNTHAGVHYNPETGEPDGGVALRKNYAGIGFKYDIDRDAFTALCKLDFGRRNLLVAVSRAYA